LPLTSPQAMPSKRSLVLTPVAPVAPAAKTAPAPAAAEPTAKRTSIARPIHVTTGVRKAGRATLNSPNQRIDVGFGILLISSNILLNIKGVPSERQELMTCGSIASAPLGPVPDFQ